MREVVSRQMCDRCGSVMAEDEGAEQTAYESVFWVDGPLLGRMEGAEARIEFSDLCDKCAERVISLVEAITKSGKGRGKGRKTRKTNTETSAPAEEQVEEASAEFVEEQAEEASAPAA